MKPKKNDTKNYLISCLTPYLQELLEQFNKILPKNTYLTNFLTNFFTQSNNNIYTLLQQKINIANMITNTQHINTEYLNNNIIDNEYYRLNICKNFYKLNIIDGKILKEV